MSVPFLEKNLLPTIVKRGSTLVRDTHLLGRIRKESLGPAWKIPLMRPTGSRVKIARDHRGSLGKTQIQAVTISWEQHTRFWQLTFYPIPLRICIITIAGNYCLLFALITHAMIRQTVFSVLKREGTFTIAFACRFIRSD